MGGLSSQTGIKPTPPAAEARSLNHWTTREFPVPMISFHAHYSYFTQEETEVHRDNIYCHEKSL